MKGQELIVSQHTENVDKAVKIYQYLRLPDLEVGERMCIHTVKFDYQFQITNK